MTTLVTSNLALLSDAPGGVEQLRSLIVELAVSGRLVPQQPEDEPSAVLAVRLKASKTQATADGARRAKVLERPETPVCPFKLPQSWTWQVLDDLLWITGGVTLGRKLAGRALVALPYLRVANVQRGFLTLHDLKDIGVPEDEIDKYLLQPGDLLITEGGDWDKVGRTAIWRGEVDRCLHQNHVFRARPCSDEFLPRWAELYLNSPEARAYFAGSSKQTTNLASINMTQLRSCAFPLPPLAEQHRIVAKVDELMALCDRLEARQQDADAAHARLVQALLDSLTQARDADEFQACWRLVAVQFPALFTSEESIDALAATVLELAVSGRLVPASSEDPPAEQLLCEVASVKAKLVEVDGLRTTARNDVPAEEHYLSISKGWSYARIGNLARFIDYRGRTPVKTTDGVPLITAKNVRPGYISREPREFIAAEEFSAWMTRGLPRLGDMLFTTEAPLGNVALIDIDERFALAQRVICFQLHRLDMGPYLRIAFMSRSVQKQILDMATGMTATGVKASRLKELPLPIPPLGEQLRIVAKVTELLALCDQLKARIVAARAKHAQLAEAIVSRAVAV